MKQELQNRFWHLLSRRHMGLAEPGLYLVKILSLIISTRTGKQ